MVFLFALIRGWLGSLCSRQGRTFLRESVTLGTILRERGLELPAPTTLLENVNVLKESTLRLVHRRQLQAALQTPVRDGADGPARARGGAV